MSSNYKKVEFTSEGPWASTEKHKLFARFNASTDSITVYHEDGTELFTYGEWGEFDMGMALVKLLGGNFNELEDCTLEEKNKLK